MNQVHFQSNLFQEIVQGIALSCEGHLFEQADLLRAAAEIYGTMHKLEEKAEKEETTIHTDWISGEAHYNRISECNTCNERFIRYPADGIKFCPMCGRRIVLKC